MEVQRSRIQSRDIEENGEELTRKGNGTLSSGSLASVVSAVNRVWGVYLGAGSEGLKSFRNTMTIYYGVLSVGLSSKDKILHSQELIQQRWNKMLLVLRVIALLLDPLFCYILVINDEKKCLRMDRTLGAIATVLRFVVDFFYLFYIIYQFRASVVTLVSHSSKQSEMAPHTRSRACRYLLLYFIFDILVILPLPQVLVFAVVPKLNDPRIYNAAKSLNILFIAQYILSVIRTCTLLKNILRESGILAESAWANLSFFMLASHALGAFWYLFSIERKATCWLEACKHLGVHCSLYCDDTLRSSTLLYDSCATNSTLFDFGIYSDALNSGVVSTDILPRILYCFWWGLQNLSSLGQSLKTSTYFWEVCFAVSVSISGLVLLALLIGNMQTYLVSKFARSKELRGIELWMYFHSLPASLKAQVHQSLNNILKENTVTDTKNFLDLLPRQLRKDIKRCICFNLLRKVPLLRYKEEQLSDVICEYLEPVLYKKNSIIFQEGDPLAEMVFITRGIIVTHTSSAGVEFLRNGDYYGLELLLWVLCSCGDSQRQLMSTDIPNFPLSTRTVKAQTEVEVFVLRVDQLEGIVSDIWFHFRKQIAVTPTWAALAVQRAFRRRHGRNRRD